MSDLEKMAANVQGQHDAIMHAQGLPTYDRLRQQNAELVAMVRMLIPFADDTQAGCAITDLARDLIATVQS